MDEIHNSSNISEREEEKSNFPGIIDSTQQLILESESSDVMKSNSQTPQTFNQKCPELPDPLSKDWKFKEFCEVEVPKNINTTTITDVFSLVSKKKNLESSQIDFNQMMAISISESKLKEIFKWVCLRLFIPQSNSNSTDKIMIYMKFVPSLVIDNNMKIIKFWLFKGDKKFFRQFVKEYKIHLNQAIVNKNLNNDKKASNENIQDIEINEKNFLNVIEIAQKELAEKKEENNIPLLMECSAYYQFGKFLLEDKHKISKFTNQFISIYLEQLPILKNKKDPSEKAKNLSQFIQEIINLSNQEFSQNDSEMKKLLPFCRISIERYVFSKVYDGLISIYDAKYANIDNEFLQQQKHIFQKRNLEEILKDLDVSKKFWLLNNNDEVAQLNQNAPLNQQDKLFLESDSYPYIDSIKELEKIGSSKCLRDKFDFIISSNTLMKMKVIDYYNGKEELNSMDDELPILIFIALHIRIKNPFSQVNLVDDYLSAFPDFEIEKRFLLNLKMAIQYIAQEYRIS